MNLIFFDDNKSTQLYPLTFTKPAAELRCGILTITEKWSKRINHEAVGYLTANFLNEKFGNEQANDNLFINGRLFPNKNISEEIENLKLGEFLCQKDTILAARLNSSQTEEFKNKLEEGKQIQAKSNFTILNHSWDIFHYNGQEIELDFELLTKGRVSQKLSSTNRATQYDRIFLEEGSKAEFSILNPNGGYIYIGKDAEIMEMMDLWVMP